MEILKRYRNPFAALRYVSCQLIEVLYGSNGGLLKENIKTGIYAFDGQTKMFVNRHRNKNYICKPFNIFNQLVNVIINRDAFALTERPARRLPRRITRHCHQLYFVGQFHNSLYQFKSVSA